jgi:hypothetical protein
MQPAQRFGSLRGMMADRILVQLLFPVQSADAHTAWPEKVFLQIDCPPYASIIILDLSWFGKRANRLPEAVWLTL